MDIRQFERGQEQLWDDFVRSSRNGTLFHTRKFLSYHPADRFVDASLFIYDEQRLVALLPAAKQDRDGVWLVSHPGSTLGGLVLSPDLNTKGCIDLVSTLKTYIQESQYAGALFQRLTASHLCESPSDDQIFALYHNGFVLSRCEIGSVKFLDGLTQDSLLESYDGKFRNQCRQSERAGISIRESGDYRAFWIHLENTLFQRHGVRPTHTIDEMLSLESIFPDDIRLFGAYDHNSLIGGIVTVDLNQRATYVKYMAQDYSAQEKRPMNALITAVAMDCLRRGKEMLDLGVSMDEKSPTGINEGLFAFKESCGARPVLRESFSHTIS